MDGRLVLHQEDLMDQSTLIYRPLYLYYRKMANKIFFSSHRPTKKLVLSCKNICFYGLSDSKKLLIADKMVL